MSEQSDYDVGFEESRKHDPEVFDQEFQAGASSSVREIVERALTAAPALTREVAR